jgi:hypothetical protein
MATNPLDTGASLIIIIIIQTLRTYILCTSQHWHAGPINLFERLTIRLCYARAIGFFGQLLSLGGVSFHVVLVVAMHFSFVFLLACFLFFHLRLNDQAFPESEKKRGGTVASFGHFLLSAREHKDGTVLHRVISLLFYRMQWGEGRENSMSFLLECMSFEADSLSFLLFSFSISFLVFSLFSPFLSLFSLSLF